MKRFVEGEDRRQATLLPDCLDDYVTEDNPVRIVEAFIYGAFSSNLDARLDGMNLPGEVRSEMEAAKAHLGAAEAPKGVDAETAVHIERAVDESFVAGFRMVMLVCIGLALASALAAALLVDDQRMQVASAEPYPSGQQRLERAGDK